jgi:hypothetical protein
MNRLTCTLLAILIGWGASSNATRGDEVDDQLAAIARTGPQAAGSSEARAAVDKLAIGGTDLLPRLLAAMDTDNPVAANWYRTAYESIVDRELGRKATFPLAELKAFAADRQHRGHVRRLALALCERLDPGYEKKLVRGLLDDPEFRNDAVAMALAAGSEALAAGDSETARDAFHKAFDHARDAAQVTSAAAGLTKLGEQVDIPRHLGLVVDWWLVGPFDAPQFSGFGRAFEPESQVDLAKSYAGQNGVELKWRPYRSGDPLGTVDLVQALAPAKEAVGYAYAEIDSPREQQAQLRAGADDNLTAWLNGQKVFSREQWLNGSRFDRFVTPVKLVAGKNRLLVKICQGPQHVNPEVPNNWTFQLRFCDEQGAGVPFTATTTASGGAQ